MKFKKALCLFFALLMVVTVYLPKLDVNAAKVKDYDFIVNSDYEIENENFVLTANESGEVKLLVKATGQYWYSNPVDEEMNAQVNGINKMKMMSQLIVTYLVNEKNEKQATSRASVTNKKGIKVKTTDDGIRIDYNFVKEEFIIPVLYKIDSKGMTAEILNSEIKENGENSVIKIILLPYWGAASTKENGYFLVPDGSGALINFNNGKGTSNYQQDIYNTDGLMNVESNVTTTEGALMPIFGIKKDESSALAVIESGESNCKLYSFVSGANGPYNIIYPEFTYRKSANIKMLSKTWYPLEVTFVSKKKVDNENFAVKYIPITKNTNDYSGMANEYREYLKANAKFKNNPKAGYVPLYLDIYASVLVSDNFLGFPITVNKALTDCEDVEEIIEELKQNGIKDINIRYKGTTKNGLTNKNVPNKFKVASSIGGKKGLSQLMEYAKDNQTVIYPDYDFVFLRRNKNSIFKPSNVIQDVRHKNGVFYDYDVSSGVALSNKGIKYALKVESIEKNINRFLKSYKKFGGESLSLSTLGNTIFSDFGKDVYLSGETKLKFEEILNNLSKDMNTMLEAPNIYALPYADCVIAVSSESSKYDIEDECVPFYQMVLHGLVSYSTTSINSSSDSKISMLKAIETGSCVMYSLSATEYSEIINDGYDQLNCVYVEDWLDEIMEVGNTVYSALKDVSNSEIVKHCRIENDVYYTEYANGIGIYVNYGSNDVIIDDMTVKAMDYYVCGGGAR